ncbi:hypothetical protein PVAP13_6KG253012 [Panicum virgatum]|uniref:Uncharacterized protein n=1 Tax=Panicum virgatum TaxID=38727 RepID=A0A8T0RER4_PANVG|nr:hypothetical protein PVAP13_6KG253012 [Panicum virgatum]
MLVTPPPCSEIRCRRIWLLHLAGLSVAGVKTERRSGGCARGAAAQAHRDGVHVELVATTGAEKGWGGGGDGHRQARRRCGGPRRPLRGPASSFPGGNDARSGAPRPPPRRQPRHPPPRWLRRYGARGNYRARGRRRNCGERGRAGSELWRAWARGIRIARRLGKTSRTTGR